jgi:hypothetical protein
MFFSYKMEYGEERGWMERTGDRMYEKEEWKKIPTERFMNYATQTLNILVPYMPQEQTEWLYSNLSNIPSYETYNPYATVLGFSTLDWKTKKINEKLFKTMTSKYASGLHINSADVLRYARKWEYSWLPELL